ncbi:tetratricopeptide repeat protein [Phormidium sp. LEGE 05292]|uniref:tetratricopeptide repeat protein n=1 Tax=[Phormidium] sp. LEGE 05292 TaxID=767427 RepID=UPI00187E160A|nr:tetratricopeptide repeat protein [Phormidium sp. LEGE 05292]MBE9224109.1 tetratricopeptide repeat protein [Phormidium sp. LEGE 05292]
MWLGIDFGTSNSSAIFMQGWVPSLVEIPGREQVYSLPTCVYVKKETEIYVGYEAYNQRLRDASRYKELFKRDLGRTKPYYIGDCELLPEDLVVKVIAKLKALAESQFNVKLTRVTLAVPASHPEHKRQLMVEAGKKAGFSQVALVDEPVAAAIYYAQRSSTKDGEILLVYDLGGGTFDVALIQRRGSGYKSLTLPLGDPQCGGMDFDRKIFEDFKARCNLEQRELLERQDTQALRTRFTLNDYCRSLKENLSTKQEDSFTIPLFGEEQEYRLTRTAFELMITPYLEKTLQLCRQLVRNAGLTEEQVDKILLVGGSCQIPYVRQVMEREFQRPVLRFDDPDLAVCKGAGLYEGWNPAYESLQAGIDRADVGDYHGAIEKYNEALQINSNYARAYVERSRAHLELGNHDQVIEDVERAIQLEPKYADAYGGYADLYFRLGEDERAIAQFQRTIEINPNDIGAYCELGRCYSALGEKEKALDSWHQALKITPQSAGDFSNRGSIYHWLEEEQSALEQYNKAIELNHRSVDAYVGRALVYAKLKNHQAVTDDFNEALRLNPNCTHAFGWRGIYFYEELGDFERAIAEFNLALDLNPNYIAIYSHRGLCHTLMGNAEQAITDFKQILQTNPNDSSAYSGLGNVYSAIENYQEATDNFNKALQINPKNSVAYSGLGDIASNQDKPEQAITNYKKAIELEPKLVSAYLGLGKVYLVLGNYQEAIDNFNKAIQINPKNPVAYSELGDIFYDQENLEQAIANYKQAIEIEPEFVAAYLGLGQVYLVLGNYQEAIDNFNQSIQINPKNPVAYFNLGTAFHSQDNLEQAIANYRQAIELEPEYTRVYNQLGVALQQQGELDEAILAYREAVMLVPDYARANSNLGYALLQQEETEEGIEFLEIARELFRTAENHKEADEIDAFLQKRIAETYYQRGEEFFEQDKFAEAIAAYQEAIRIDSSYVDAYFKMGIASFKQGKRSQASIALRKARDLFREQGNEELANEINNFLRREGLGLG